MLSKLRPGLHNSHVENRHCELFDQDTAKLTFYQSHRQDYCCAPVVSPCTSGVFCGVDREFHRTSSHCLCVYLQLSLEKMLPLGEFSDALLV